MTTFGRDLIASAREALAIAEGEAEPGRVFAPPGVDVAAVRDGEQRRRRPDAAARTLLIVIDREPRAVERASRVA